jgi:hypothetical protein
VKVILGMLGVRVTRVMQRISSPVVYICAVSLFAAAALFFWQGWVDVSLWDEGFLWYGAQRFLYGDVPIRDFYAYDVGRYAVLAGFMWLWGNTGIIALRFGLMFVQAAVLAGCTVYLYRRVTRQWVVIGGVMAVVIWWLWPLYRMPDFAVLVVALITLARVQHYQLTARQAFVAGLLYGLVLAAGGDLRKHGSFFVMSLVMVLVIRYMKYRQPRRWIRQGMYVLGGVIAGVSPLVLYVTLTPGLLQSYIQHMVVGFFERESANIPLPVPWPWLVSFQDPLMGIRDLSIGMGFVALVFVPLALVTLLVRRAFAHRTVHPFVQGAVLYALPSITYAFSRADLVHLAQGALPALLAGLVLVIQERPRWVKPILVCGSVISAIIFWPVQPRQQCQLPNSCRATQVGPDILSVPNQTADEIALLIRMRNDFVANDETLLIAPFWPGAYAMLGLEAPMWDIYAIWPRSDVQQRTEIARIATAAPRAIIVMNKGMDDRSALRFSLSHRLVYTYILETYDQIRNYTTLPGYSIFRIRDYD